MIVRLPFFWSEKKNGRIQGASVVNSMWDVRVMDSNTLAGLAGWIFLQGLHVAPSSSQRDDWVQVWVSHNREGKPGRSCLTCYHLALYLFIFELFILYWGTAD